MWTFIDSALPYLCNPIVFSMVMLGNQEEKQKNQDRGIYVFSEFITAFIFSAMLTGIWVFGHYIFSFMFDFSFDKAKFLGARFETLNRLVYLTSPICLLTYHLLTQTTFASKKIIFFFLQLLLLLGCYALLINYIYWIKHVS